MIKRTTLIGLGALMGCGSPELVTPPPPRPAESAMVTATASASVAPPPAPISMFGVVAELPDSVMIFSVEGALIVAPTTSVVADAIPQWVPDAEKGSFSNGGLPIGVFQSGRAHFSKTMFLEASWMRIIDIAGSWPTNIQVIAEGTDGRAPSADQLSLGDRGWYWTHPNVGGTAFVGMGRSAGAFYGMSVPSLAYKSVWLPQVRSLGKKTSLYKPTPASKADCWDDDLRMMSQMAVVAPRAFGATGDGQLISIGTTCKDESAVELWKPGVATSTIQVVPALRVDDWGERFVRIVPGQGSTAFVLGKAPMRYDGKSFTALSLPRGETALSNAAVMPDGTLWVLGGEGGVYRSAGAEWERAPLPGGAKAYDIAEHDGGLYVVSGASLLRYGVTSDKPIKAGGSVAPKRRSPVPGSSNCPQNVVVLYAFTKVTPDDYDFPLTRKALKGHMELKEARFAVTRDLGQKFFTARMPSYAAAERLRALIEKEVQGSKPQVVCADPEVVREVKIDLRTGALVK